MRKNLPRCTSANCVSAAWCHPLPDDPVAVVAVALVPKAQEAVLTERVMWNNEGGSDQFRGKPLEIF